jgi:hypothetical protein
MIPALVLAEQDRHRGDLDAAQEDFIFQSIRDLVDDMAGRPDVAGAAVGPPEAAPHDQEQPPAARVTVLCVPAKDQADELAALMLAGLLQRAGLQVEVASSEMLTRDHAHTIEKFKPDLVCVSAVPPLALLHARYMCMRFRSQYPDLRLVVGLWQSRTDLEKLKAKLPVSIVEHTVLTLADAVTRIVAMARSESTRSPIPMEKEKPPIR